METQNKQKKFRNNYLFDYLKNILTLKSDELYNQHLNDDFEGSYQPFMINNYLSMSTNCKVRQIIFDNQLQLDHLSKKDHYRFLLKSIPYQSSSFIKYIK